MLSAGIWRKNQPNTILFVLIDAGGSEVSGLGSTFTIQLSKDGAAFQAGLGTKSEIGNGWYRYTATAGESDTSGPIAVLAEHASIIQQNLEYVVEDRVSTAIEFTYTLTSTSGGTPIENADIMIYLDPTATNFVWGGKTDSFGVARDIFDEKPRLEPGTYYFFRYKPYFVFDNPDIETVS